MLSSFWTKCLVDNVFGLQFFLVFATVAALCSPGCLVVPVVIAIPTRCDTGRMECRHAAIRRILLAKSGTWAAHIAHLSANYMCSLARRCDFVVAPSGEDDQDENEDGQHHGELRQGYGGPSQYFVRKWLSGVIGSADDQEVGDASKEARHRSFTRMWAEYRRIKLAGGPEWAELVEHGEWGTEASRTWAPAFGAKPSTLSIPTIPRLFNPFDGDGLAEQAGAPASQTASRCPAQGHLIAPAVVGLELHQAKVNVLKALIRQAGRASKEERRKAEEGTAVIRRWSESAITRLEASGLRLVPGILSAGGASRLPTFDLRNLR